MPKQRRDHCSTLVMNTAADIPGTCSSQQAAAAWAWLQHGGGSCITPRRAEGLMAANLTAKCKWSRPSRFKMELIRRAATMQEDIGASVSQRYTEAEDGAACGSKVQARRRHSFHVEDLGGGLEVAARVAGSFRPSSSATDETRSAEMVADHDDEDCMKEYYNLHGGRLDEASSLLDEEELEAVWKQISTTPTSMSKPDPLRPAAMASAQKPILSPPPELKPRRRLYRSIDDLSTHKKWRSLSTRFHHHHHHHHGDDQRHAGHHQNAGHLLHQLLRFRSGRSPAYCSSIATVNSIVDHHPSVSPKKFRAHAVVSQENLQKSVAVDERCSTDQQIGGITKQSGPGKFTVLKRADEGIAADQMQEKERSASSRHRDLQVPLPQLVAAPAATLSRHHSYSKLFQSLMHRQPQSSHVSHESASSTRGNSGKNHLHFHDHQHFHHHHHHHHHLPQQQQQQLFIIDDQQHRAADAAAHLGPNNLMVDVVSGHVQRRPLLTYSGQKLGSRECTAEKYEGGQLHLIAYS